MNFAGTYTYLMDTPSGKRETKVVIRKVARGYEGELISSHGGCELLEENETDCIGSLGPACGGCLWGQGFAVCP